MRYTKSAGGVVVNSEGNVLVVNQNGTSWSLPKGHIDPGEDAMVAAGREIKEESGISLLTFVKGLGTYQRYKIGVKGNDEKTEHKTIIMFLYTTTQLELKPLDHRNPEARWVKPDEVAELLTHPKDKEFFASVIGDVKKLLN